MTQACSSLPDQIINLHEPVLAQPVLSDSSRGLVDLEQTFGRCDVSAALRSSGTSSNSDQSCAGLNQVCAGV